MTIAIHEAGGQDVTFQIEVAFALVTGGGQRGACHLLYQNTVGSLCQDDYKGPNRQYVEQEKLIVEIIE